MESKSEWTEISVKTEERKGMEAEGRRQEGVFKGFKNEMK